MSSESLSTYTPSPEELARIEAERRRREEEERRRLEEEMRRRLIAEEKARSEWARDYAATAVRYQIAALLDRVTRIESLSREARDRLIADIQRGDNLERLERRVSEHEAECRQSSIQPQPLLIGDVIARLRVTLSDQIAIAAVDPETRDRWQRLIDLAENEGAAYASMHASRLRQIERELHTTLANAASEYDRLRLELAACSVESRSVHAVTPDGETRQVLAGLVNEVEALRVAPLWQQRRDWADLRTSVARALEEARSVSIAAATQIHFVAAVIESLEAMGCVVEPIVSRPGSASVNAQTREGDRIEMRVSGKNLYSQFIHVSNETSSEQSEVVAEVRARDWCEAGSILERELVARHMKLDVHWTIDPSETVRVQYSTPPENDTAQRTSTKRSRHS